MRVKIREFEEKDIEAITALRHILFPEATEKELNIVDILTKNYLLNALKEHNKLVWVAEGKNEITAIAMGNITQYPPTPSKLYNKQIHLSYIITRPEYRRQGIATKLLTHIIRWCKHQGLKRITLYSNKQSKHLYKKFHFKPNKTIRKLDITHN